MKALTLWQPWATLVAIGAKKIETRSWATSYRGPLLICAAKRPIDRETWDWIHTEEAAVEALRFVDDLPLGVVVCQAELVDCIPTGKGLIRATVRESRLGDFTAGRFGWMLDGVKRLAEPLPIRGEQGLFNVPEDVAAEAERLWKAWQLEGEK